MRDAEPIRVLITLHQGGGSGAVNSTLYLAVGLAEAGVTVRFVCPPNSPVEAEARARGLEVHPLGLAPRSRWTNANRLADLLARHPVDLINSQSSRDREAFTLLGVMGRLDLPLIFTRRSWPRTTRIENWFAGRVANRVIALSEPVRAALEAGGVPAEKLTVVQNGVLTDRLDRPVSVVELDRWRHRIRWDAGHRTIGIVARPKDQMVVLQSLSLVEQPVRLVLSGLTPEALAEPLPSIPERHVVVRLPFDPEIRPLYELLEVALHPSRWDALPQAVLEAMALGKPVIASKATGNEVIIRDGIDGLLAHPEDPGDWAAKLNRLLGDAILARQLSQEGRRRAREDFSLEKTVSETISAYREVLARYRVPSTESVRANPVPRTRYSVLLAYDFPPRSGGIARALGEIARATAPSMLVCTGRTPEDTAWDRAASVRVMRAPVDAERLRTIGGLARWGRTAEQLIRTDRIDFVWAGNIKPAGHIARWLERRRGIPYGLIAYGLDLGILAEQSARSARKRAAARAILGNAAVIVAISSWTADRCRQLFQQLDLPLIPDRLRVILLGADPTRFTPSGSRYPLGPGRWLLTVARLMPHKGIDTAIEAVAHLARTHPDLHYAVAGDGPDLDRLTRLATGLGIVDRVRFLGSVEEADLPSLYRSAEVYLGLSRQEGKEVEGFGLSLAEAQASGVAVVAARSGGIPETVLPQAGILVSPGNPTEAAIAVGALLNDEARRSALGKGGRERAERELNWARVVQDLRRAESASRESPR